MVFVGKIQYKKYKNEWKINNITTPFLRKWFTYIPAKNILLKRDPFMPLLRELYRPNDNFYQYMDVPQKVPVYE